ncbi:MAG: peptidoglycan DD-metalloendopeptidase family protein [Patescibacteria group bacterium]|jgi:hypothetical protein
MNVKKVVVFSGLFVFGISLDSSAAPIEIWAPWEVGQRWQLGNAGSFYGEGYHVGASHFCVDANAVDSDDMGQDLLAAADGTVSQAFFNDGYGWMVRIDHANNTQTLYAHLLEQPVVFVGQRVSHGDVIGRCDNTPGMPFSTGSHLHFCLFQNGVSVPPSPMEGHDIFNGIIITSQNRSQPRYSCEYYRQDPEGLIELKQGEEKDFVVAFRNTGSNSWSNVRDNNNYIELRSVNHDGQLAPSFLCHESWLGNNCQRVTSQTANRVSSSEIAWFNFKVLASENIELDHEYKVYFRIWHKLAGYLDDWAEMHFRVIVRRIIECQVGQIETKPCDFCGQQIRNCTDRLLWTEWSQCGLLPGLECDPNQFDIQPCGHCGSMRRDCDITCHYGPWDICREQGVCEPNQVEEIECPFNIGECRIGHATRTCGPTCLWASISDCVPVGRSPEVCDLKDNDCNGSIDDGAHCKQQVFRYYYNNNGDVAHLYRLENDGVDGYRFEGAQFKTYRDKVDDRLTKLFKLRRENPRDHFYTISVNERDGAVGYERRGDIGYCSRVEVSGSIPLFRLYNNNATDHFYTTSRDERNYASESLGYNREGIECYVWEP